MKERIKLENHIYGMVLQSSITKEMIVSTRNGYYRYSTEGLKKAFLILINEEAAPEAIKETINKNKILAAVKQIT